MDMQSKSIKTFDLNAYDKPFASMRLQKETWAECDQLGLSDMISSGQI